MGKSKAERAFEKLSKELAPAKKNGFFADDHDRDQFVHAILAVATQNGLINLDDHDFRIIYSRRGEKEDRIVARLVAIKNGVMEAKIEPQADGKDQTEALKALRKTVEVQLDQILESIPSGSVSAAARSSNLTSPAAVDAPPAYTNAGLMDQNDEFTWTPIVENLIANQRVGHREERQ